jgi:hypothetical protein
MEQVKIAVRELEMSSSELGSQLRSPISVFTVPSFVHPPGIMENGKQFDDCDSGSGLLG